LKAIANEYLKPICLSFDITAALPGQSENASAKAWQKNEEIAKKKKHRFIREEDVDQMWKTFVPFDVNEYEDVIFFPRLGRSGSLTIEAYDFDAFRDSGIHWLYLQFALKDHLRELSLEPDPFAAELLVEGIAQFGVLALRVAGMKAKEEGVDRLKVEHLTNAFQDIQERVKMPKDVIGSVMVLGGGIAGMQAAVDLADSGYYVYLVEKGSSIGGVMSQLDKTFPTNDCAM